MLSVKLLLAPVDAAYPMRDGIEVMSSMATAYLLAAQDPTEPHPPVPRCVSS